MEMDNFSKKSYIPIYIGMSIKRGVLICGGITLLALIYLLFSGIALFLNARSIRARVADVDIVATKKKTYLTLSLSGDSRIYYQVYEDRFQDIGINQIEKGALISFYTTTNRFSVDRPILASSDFNQFEYYPIFDVNKSKNMMHFISYYLFGGSWINIIFYFSSAGTVFYLIPYVVATSWSKRLFLIALVGIWAWLFI